MAAKSTHERAQLQLTLWLRSSRCSSSTARWISSLLPWTRRRTAAWHRSGESRTCRWCHQSDRTRRGAAAGAPALSACYRRRRACRRWSGSSGRSKWAPGHLHRVCVVFVSCLCSLSCVFVVDKCLFRLIFVAFFFCVPWEFACDRVFQYTGRQHHNSYTESFVYYCSNQRRYCR